MHIIKNGDIGFHFNPRFDQNCVVRNSRVRGVWGPEERRPENRVPFALGQPFEMIILIDQTDIKVAVNSKHFIEYKHRLPFTSMKIFNVEGDLAVDKIEFRQEVAVSGTSPPPQPIGFAAGNSGMQPVLNPSLPLRLPLVGGVRPGLMVYISGRPTPYCSQFAIDFIKTAGQSTDAADIAFHFNARQTDQMAVRNSRVNMVWQAEERAVTRPYPFAPGVNFDMIIRVEANRYLVAVNGQHYIEFNHRVLPLQSIDLFNIRGDVTISSVRFHFA